jgi:AcrR family transcriptional regulator
VVKRDSRELILKSAKTEFAAGGLGGARVERIARRAGVNKQLIFYYFGSKARLYDAVLDSAAIELSEATAAKAPSALRETLGEVYRRLREHPETLALLLQGIRERSAQDPSIARSLTQPWREIRDAISAGQGVGLVRDDVDPDTLALQAVVLVVGYLVLEPALSRMPRSVPQDRWTTLVGETFTRILAW